MGCLLSSFDSPVPPDMDFEMDVKGHPNRTVPENDDLIDIDGGSGYLIVKVAIEQSFMIFSSVIMGYVFDLTDFVHPGGEDRIAPARGCDGTE